MPDPTTSGCPDQRVAALAAATVIHRIVFDRAGGQIREPVTGAKTVGTFVYPSGRYARSHLGEGETEYLLTQHAESMAGWLDYAPQPCRIEGGVNGKAATAFPDYGVLRVGGRPTLGEAKRDWHDFDEPDALVQQAITRRAAEALGWGYERVTLASLNAAACREAVEEVQSHRFQHVDPAQERLARKAVSCGRKLPLGRLIGMLESCPVTGRAVACALAVRRAIAIDLSAPITGATLVGRAPAPPIDPPRLRL